MSFAFLATHHIICIIPCIIFKRSVWYIKYDDDDVCVMHVVCY